MEIEVNSVYIDLYELLFILTIKLEDRSSNY
jgi:hypothetical protein